MKHGSGRAEIPLLINIFFINSWEQHETVLPKPKESNREGKIAILRRSGKTFYARQSAWDNQDFVKLKDQIRILKY